MLDRGTGASVPPRKPLCGASPARAGASRPLVTSEPCCRRYQRLDWWRDGRPRASSTDAGSVLEVDDAEEVLSGGGLPFRRARPCRGRPVARRPGGPDTSARPQRARLRASRRRHEHEHGRRRPGGELPGGLPGVRLRHPADRANPAIRATRAPVPKAPGFLEGVVQYSRRRGSRWWTCGSGSSSTPHPGGDPADDPEPGRSAGGVVVDEVREVLRVDSTAITAPARSCADWPPPTSPASSPVRDGPSSSSTRAQLLTSTERLALSAIGSTR